MNTLFASSLLLGNSNNSLLEVFSIFSHFFHHVLANPLHPGERRGRMGEGEGLKIHRWNPVMNEQQVKVRGRDTDHVESMHSFLCENAQQHAVTAVAFFIWGPQENTHA